MLMKRISLISLIFIGFFASTAVYGQRINFSKLYLSSSGSNTRAIELLSLDRDTNINSNQAASIMNGLFKGVEIMGSYRINLNFEEVSSKTRLGIVIGLIGGIVEETTYRLTANISIKDLKNNSVYTVIKTQFYKAYYTLYDLYIITEMRKKKISAIYSELIKNCKEEISSNAAAINNKLRSDQLPVKIFNEISPRLQQGSKIAIIPAKSREENVLLAARQIEAHFVNSRRYRILERSNIDAIINEVAFGMSVFSEGMSVQIGRMLSANFIVLCDVVAIGSNRTLSFRVLNVESGEVMASAFHDLSI